MRETKSIKALKIELILFSVVSNISFLGVQLIDDVVSRIFQTLLCIGYNWFVFAFWYDYQDEKRNREKRNEKN